MASPGRRRVRGLNFKLRGIFFNDPLIFRSVDKATVKNLTKWGAFVRSDARKSMKKAGKKTPPSPPGTPPRSRVGHIKRFMYFLWDPKTRSVVIGPQAFYVNKGLQVVELQEKGGTRKIRRRKRNRVAKYPARPYMKPAMDKNLPQLPKLWQNSVKPG